MLALDTVTRFIANITVIVCLLSGGGFLPIYLKTVNWHWTETRPLQTTAPSLACTQPWRHSPHWDTISPCHEKGVLQSIVNTSNNIIFVQAGRFIFFHNTALGILELKHGILHFYLFQCQDGFNLSFQLLIGFSKELDFFLS